MFSREPGRTLVKICGITHPEDAALAVALGADALGLNFFPGSPRCLDRVGDAGWLRELSGVVLRVAVVVNAARSQLDALLEANLVDAVQLHGDEDVAFCLSLHNDKIPFAKAFRVRDADSLRHAGDFSTDWLLLDAYHPGAYGGTGKTMDWELAARFVVESKSQGKVVLLSGGLHPGNVAEAVRRVHPFGVDVASGVETDGDRRRKDAARLREFFAEVRAADGSRAASGGR